MLFARHIQAIHVYF